MNSVKGIVFDLYGTLYDVHTVAALCDAHDPGRGLEISVLWRQKQLEYTWLRSLMNQYASFEQATEDALNYTCARLGLELDAKQRSALCDAYLHLRPFPEVPTALRALNERGIPLAILSNGSTHTINAVVRNSGLTHEFAHLISVESAGIFKPHIRVYELAERAMGLPKNEILFVSSNAWDATGAAYYGYTTCWVNRGTGTFDEMGQRPDHVVSGIDGISAVLVGQPA
jgi:2-haloacid dehalogenase